MSSHLLVDLSLSVHVSWAHHGSKFFLAQVQADILGVVIHVLRAQIAIHDGRSSGNFRHYFAWSCCSRRTTGLRLSQFARHFASIRVCNVMELSISSIAERSNICRSSVGRRLHLSGRLQRCKRKVAVEINQKTTWENKISLIVELHTGLHKQLTAGNAPLI